MDAEVVIAVVIRLDGRVLMVRRKQAEGALRWSFPGGKINDREAEGDASKREVEEESGVQCFPLRKIGQWTHPDTAREISYWLCTHAGGKAQVREPEKIDRVEWLTPDQIVQRVGSAIFPKVMTEIRANAASRIASAVPA